MQKLYFFIAVSVLVCWGIFALFTASNCAVKHYVYPLKFKDEIFYASDYYGLNRALVFSVVKTESDFDENATSGKGAIGLMQITESTGEYIADLKGAVNYELKDVKTNLDFGCYYLKYLLTKFEDVNTALYAYNAGEGRVQLWLMESKFSEDGKRLKSVPIEETKEYVEKINESFLKYKKLYGKLLDKSVNIE